MEDKYRLPIQEVKEMFKIGLVYEYIKEDRFTFEVTSIEDNDVFGFIIKDEGWENDEGKVVKICELDDVYSDDFKQIKHYNTKLWRKLNGKLNYRIERKRLSSDSESL